MAAEPRGLVCRIEGGGPLSPRSLACLGAPPPPPCVPQDWAAAAQTYFNEHVMAPLRAYPALVRAVDGIVVSGAGGYNRALNTAIHRAFGRPVFVPSILGDDNLAIGYVANLVRPPTPDFTSFLGLPLVPDPGQSAQVCGPDGPRPVPDAACAPASAPHLAGLLAAGAVVAAVRGRAEVGRHSLGHRTVLAHPASAAAASFASKGNALHVLLAEADAAALLAAPWAATETGVFHHRLSPRVLRQSDFLRAEAPGGVVVGVMVSRSSTAWLVDVLQELQAQVEAVGGRRGVLCSRGRGGGGGRR